jgi:hypothetical protein
MIGFGALIALVLGLAWSSLSAVGRLGKELDTEINQTSAKLELSSAMANHANQMRAAQRRVVLFDMLKEPPKVEQSKKAFQEGLNGLQKAIADIRPLIYKPRDGKPWRSFKRN